MIESGAVRTHESPFPMVFSVVVFALICLIGGLFPISLIRLAGFAASVILGGGII